MRCLVIGAGINGILTAHALQNKSYNVDVIDAAATVGTRATFANGCQLSFSHTTPMNIAPSFFSHSFAKPVMWHKNQKRWLKDHRQSQNTFEDKFHTLMEHANDSKDAFNDIFHQYPNVPEGIGHSSGTVFLFSNTKQFEFRKKMFSIQKDRYKIDSQSYTLEDIPDVDESLSLLNNVSNTIFTPADKTIDSIKFTQFIAEEFQKKGGRIFFNTKALMVEHSYGMVKKIITDKCAYTNYDVYVYAGGASGVSILKDFNLNLQPVTGYSITFDVSYSNYCPLVNLIDFTNKVVYSRHENKLRVAGFFDIAPPKNPNKRIQELYKVALNTLPFLKRQEVIHTWSEQRVFTHNEIPQIRKISQNFAINTAQGHLGVTLSAGSAKKVSKLFV